MQHNESAQVYKTTSVTLMSDTARLAGPRLLRQVRRPRTSSQHAGSEGVGGDSDGRMEDAFRWQSMSYV